MGNESSTQSVEDVAPEPSKNHGPRQQDASNFCEGSSATHVSSSTRRSTTDASARKVGKQEAAEANARGVELLKQQKYEEAVTRFKEALNYEPGSVQILNNIGLSYARMQDHNSAYEWYEKAYNQDKRDVETLFSLAWVECKRHNYNNSQQLFQKLLEEQPEHIKALYLLGWIMKTNHEYEGAARHLERLVRHDPDHIEGHIALGQCYEHLKQYPRASQLYDKILQLDPRRVDVIHLLGRVQFLMKQYKQALEYFDRVPDSDSRAFEARATSAKACRELEDHAGSISYGERAAKLKPHPEVMHMLGEANMQLGDAQKASQWFAKAVELEPNLIPSLLELGLLMYKQSRFQEAETHLGRVCDLDRTNLAALKGLAMALYKLKKYGACRVCCEATVQLEPLNAEALWLLAEINKSDERWFLSLRYPPEVAVADVCMVITKGYLARGQMTVGEQWLKKVQQYLPSDPLVQEAVKILAKPSGSVTPQDVIDILELRRTPASAFAPRERTPAAVGSLLPPTSAGAEMSARANGAMRDVDMGSTAVGNNTAEAKPWLIEVNHAPSSRAETELDSVVTFQALYDAFETLNISPEEVWLEVSGQLVQTHKKVPVPKAGIKIGRSDHMNLVKEDVLNHISREHFKLEPIDAGFLLEVLSENSATVRFPPGNVAEAKKNVKIVICLGSSICLLNLGGQEVCWELHNSTSKEKACMELPTIPVPVCMGLPTNPVPMCNQSNTSVQQAMPTSLEEIRVVEDPQLVFITASFHGNKEGIAEIPTEHTLTTWENLFKNAMNFDYDNAIRIADESEEDLVEALDSSLREPRVRRKDSVIIAINSHGCENGFLTYSPKSRKGQELVEFNSFQTRIEQVVALRGKPKIFFYDCCLTKQEAIIAQETSYALSNKDSVALFATSPGARSFAEHHVGALFSKKLEEAFLLLLDEHNGQVAWNSLCMMMSRLMQAQTNATLPSAVGNLSYELILKPGTSIPQGINMKCGYPKCTKARYKKTTETDYFKGCAVHWKKLQA